MRSHRQSFLISAESLLCLHSRVPLLQHQRHHTRHGASPPSCVPISHRTQAHRQARSDITCATRHDEVQDCSCRAFTHTHKHFPHLWYTEVPSCMAHTQTPHIFAYTNTARALVQACTHPHAHVPKHTCTIHHACIHTHTHTHTHTHLISLSRCLDLCSK